MGSELELEIWRAVGRHMALEASLAEIAPLLARSLPAEHLVVRHLDAHRGQLETVAVGTCRPAPEPLRGRTPCSPVQLRTLVDWLREGSVRLARPREDPVVDLAAPAGDWSAALACPLVAAGEPLGILLVLTRSAVGFDGSHRTVARRLVDPVSAALKNHLHLHELARLREALEADRNALLSRLQRDDIVDALVGGEAGLAEVLERVRQVAPTDAPVLLYGETGTGKEVVARAVHAQSRRADGPIVCVNCGAIPPDLVDSELFGHERGSFTGAVAARKGWFERADGGTLFLDEFGELPGAAQVRLLRVLQDGTLERVGGQHPLSVDVRVIAATNLDLEHLVASGRFREDLWFRISVFPIRIPTLRERREDIPALAAHFAARAGRRLGAGPLVPDPHDLHLLLSYDWPGNVRELASVIERAAILGNGRRLEMAAALGAATTSAQPFAEAPRADVPPDPVSFPTLDHAMVRHIERALTLTRGRIEGPHGASRLLGINPHTLRARMRKLGVDWRRFRGD